jgi:hypothetical protein
MKIQKTAALFILGFFLASLWGFGLATELSKQDARALRKLVVLRPGLKVPEEVIGKLLAKISDDNQDLQQYFGKGNYIDVAKRLGERGTSLLTPKYEKMWGKHSAQFWRDSATAGATLEIVPGAIYITDAIGPQKVQVCLPDAKTNTLGSQEINYNLTATVTQEFHVKETSAPMHNATSIGALVYRHRNECVWE